LRSSCATTLPRRRQHPVRFFFFFCCIIPRSLSWASAENYYE
jgi:hypothetical protein